MVNDKSYIANNDSYNRILKYVDKHKSTLDATFKLIIIDLITKTDLDYHTLKKILNGAHVIIKDEGYFYKKWIYYHKLYLKKQNKVIDTMYASSSHNSCLPQYRLGNGIIYNINDEITNKFDLLIGTSCSSLNSYKRCDLNKCRSKTGNTWFQLERSRLSTIINTITHIFDYFTYLINGRNIGPFGESEHTETNRPIIIRLKDKEEYLYS